MLVFNVYDAAKMFAMIGIGIVVLGIISAPFFAVAEVINSLSHLEDNGYGPLWILPVTGLAAFAFFVWKRRWVWTAVIGIAVVATGIMIVSASAGLRGDVVAYGSERNEQWAAALANEPRWVDVAWLEPEPIRQLRDDVTVSCCTSDLILREEGSYPKDTGIGTRVGKYRIARRGELATTTFLTDYIDVVEDGAGDWLAYYNACLAPAQMDMEDFSRRYGAGAAKRVAHENTMKLSRRAPACETMESVDSAYSLNLGETIMAAITRDGGRAAGLLETEGLDAACTAHDQCRMFEADFAIDVK